jgi:hypothetical protein
VAEQRDGVGAEELGDPALDLFTQRVVGEIRLTCRSAVRRTDPAKVVLNVASGRILVSALSTGRRPARSPCRSGRSWSSASARSPLPPSRGSVPRVATFSAHPREERVEDSLCFGGKRLVCGLLFLPDAVHEDDLRHRSPFDDVHQACVSYNASWR